MNLHGAEGYWLTRFVFERALGLIFLIAFLNAVFQFKALLGERGLLPVPLYLKRTSFRESPGLFFLFPVDTAFTVCAWIGVVLSAAVLTGIADGFTIWFHLLTWSALWVLYISFVNAGQTFYSFGWESILLEACVYAIFMGNRFTTPPVIPLWMERWLLFRVMFGAGLIKLRADPCWRDLTCLDYHYETQPMPNPLSWYFHWAPEWTHKAGVLVNHIAELIVPFGYFFPQPVSSIAGILTIAFQGLIFASGNLSFLNLLTAVLAIPTLDGRFLSALIPVHPPILHPPSIVLQVAIAALALLVAILSVQPVRNLLSRRQVMNTVYNRFHFVGTYGAFGSITRPRYEVIVEGTEDTIISASTHWREYGFKGKPGDPARVPPQVAPYHLRLDWLMWFAAMSSYYRHAWFVHFLAKLLEGDAPTLRLLKTNPFPDRPPRLVRALLYEYRFTNPAEHAATGHWWKREFVSVYFPAVSLETPAFRDVLEQQGWIAPARRAKV